VYNFHPVDREQKFLLPVDMGDWLSRDHFVYFLIELAGLLDLSGFLKEYRSDGKGGAAYHPRMMLTLLLYAYCDGERSTRRIEERCRTDIAYRIATGGHMPDHTTIARFRDRHEEAIADAFVPILGVCLRAGMGEVSLAAVDGSKFRCPASMRANRTLAGIDKELARLTAEIEAELARIAAEVLAASRRADIEDDTLFGPRPCGSPGPCPTCPDCRRSCAARPPGGPAWPKPKTSSNKNGPPSAPPTTSGWPNGPPSRRRPGRRAAGASPPRRSATPARRPT
jgi:transposase